MDKISIFKASFEESSNLMDDPISGKFIIDNLSSAQEKEQFRGTLKSNIWLIILTIILIFGPNWLLAKISDYLIPYVENRYQIATVHNFLPEWIVYFFALGWLLIILILKKFNQNFILIYRGQFHILVTFLIWLMLELNLLLVTVFGGQIGIFRMLILIGLFIFLSYSIIRSRRDTLYFSLYNDRERTDSPGKIKNFNLIWLAIAILIVICFIFPNVFAHLFNEIAIIVIWMLGNLLFVSIETNYIFPFFLQAYYKLKYPEEYREWEGKSLEEWYGKKYLKKHKELLNDE